MIKRVLVTGGSGFFGAHLVKKLLALGYRVRIFDLVEPDEKVMTKVEFVKGDVRDFKTVEKACKGVEVVFHTIAVVPISKSGKKFEEVNTGGTKNVLEASLRQGVRKVIHISSTAVYAIPKKGDIITEDYSIKPIGDYGRAKYKAELVCLEYVKKGLKVTILRPRTIIGTERMGIFSILFDWIRRGKRIYILGKGDNLFSYVSASDLADACIKTINKGDGETLNIGAEEYGTFREDLETLIKYAGTNSKIVSVNADLTRAILMVLDKFRLSPLADWHYMTVDKEYVFDISKAKKILGWKPKDSNKKMFLESYDWYLKNYEKVEKKFGKTHHFAVRQSLLGVLRLIS